MLQRYKMFARQRQGVATGGPAPYVDHMVHNEGDWCRYDAVVAELGKLRDAKVAAEYQIRKLEEEAEEQRKHTHLIIDAKTKADTEAENLRNQLQKLFEAGAIEPNACPWCAHTTRVYDRQVHCEDCGATGPIGDNDIDAILQWNLGVPHV